MDESMKAMEAPEKIYLRHNHKGDIGAGWLIFPLTNNDIEYTHTDAFIEKACDAYCKVCGHYPHTTPNHICRQDCDYYKNFRNYMKGE